jgi:hypothetical protein
VKIFAQRSVDDPQFSSTPLQTVTDQLDRSYPDCENPAFHPAETLLKRLRPKFASREQRSNISQASEPAVSHSKQSREEQTSSSIHYHHGPTYIAKRDQNFAQGDNSTAANKVDQQFAEKGEGWLTKKIVSTIVTSIASLVGLLILWYLKHHGWDLKGP